MARTRNPEITKRNDTIYAKWLRGATLTSLADEYGITRQVIGRLVAERHPEEDEDLDRAAYRGYLWRLFDEVADLYAHPGFKMAPTGRAAEGPDGEAAEDTNVKLQAAELQLKVLESLRKLDARDRPAVRKFQFERSEAEQAMWAEIDRKRREMEELAARAAVPSRQVVRGEIED